MSRYNDIAAKIYVGELSRDTSERDLEKEFSYYGPLKSVWVARNPAGFAFIEFKEIRDAEDAVKALDGRLYNLKTTVLISYKYDVDLFNYFILIQERMR